MKLLVQKLLPTAILPSKGSEMAAGYDLAAAEESIVPAHGKGLISTGIAISMPEGVYGRIAPRSGLAWKRHIDVGAGVIDRDYTANIGVVLFNHGNEDFIVNIGDRVAQLILERHESADIEEVESLTATKRGSGGFGSTG